MPSRTGGYGRVGRCGDASGQEVGSSQNPGGEPSPRKERAAIDRQRSEVATDPPAEQRLEVEGRRARHTSSDARAARRPNGEEARAGGDAGPKQRSFGTAASCRWGDFFEGCEVRREEASDPPQASEHRFTGAARQVGADDCKRGEPLPVAGCNKPATPVRRKPSRWCETTRTERDRRSGIRWPKVAATSSGVCAQEAWLATVGRHRETWVDRMRGMELTQLERNPREASADTAGNC